MEVKVKIRYKDEGADAIIEQTGKIQSLSNLKNPGNQLHPDNPQFFTMVTI
jgi:hypothetical protein